MQQCEVGNIGKRELYIMCSERLSIFYSCVLNLLKRGQICSNAFIKFSSLSFRVYVCIVPLIKGVRPRNYCTAELLWLSFSTAPNWKLLLCTFYLPL